MRRRRNEFRSSRQFRLGFSDETSFVRPEGVARESEVASPLIDHSFPVEEANALARLEAYNKHLYRPNTYLHKWWARRCGTTFRFILKQLVCRPEAQDFYAPGGLEGRVVLDPMMGGGTTLHEAIRLNANVVGADLDPIPVLQARATLCEVDLREMTRVFEAFWAGLREELSQWFQTECPMCGRATDFQFMLYGVRKHCRCREVVMVESFVLRRERNGAIVLCPECGRVGLKPCPHAHEGTGVALLDKKVRKCERCSEDFQESVEEPFYSRYAPIVVVGSCAEDGRFFKAPTERDRELLAQANALRSEANALRLPLANETCFVHLGPEEDFRVLGGPKSDDLLRRGVRSYLDLFSTRQLLYLACAKRAVQALPEWAAKQVSATRLNLSLLVSTSLEFNSMLCGYKGSDERAAGAIRHTFGLHAYCFQYTAAENNPIYPHPGSGNLRNLFQDRILRGRRWAEAPVERRIGEDSKPHPVTIAGEHDSGIQTDDASALSSGSHRFLVCQRDSRRLPLPSESVDYVVTDPPYYDNVQYSDLACFFRVWLKQLLPHDTDWTYDVSNSAVAGMQNGKTNAFVENLGAIFAECARVLKVGHGRLVFTFHHWHPDAWCDLTLALRQGGFALANYYVLFSENPVSVHIQNLKALTHDCVLVLAHRESPSAPTWPPVPAIDTSDSERFCTGCGSVLGWLLPPGKSEQEVRKTWHRIIGGIVSQEVLAPFGRISSA